MWNTEKLLFNKYNLQFDCTGGEFAYMQCLKLKVYCIGRELQTGFSANSDDCEPMIAK